QAAPKHQPPPPLLRAHRVCAALLPLLNLTSAIRRPWNPRGLTLAAGLRVSMGVLIGSLQEPLFLLPRRVPWLPPDQLYHRLLLLPFLRSPSKRHPKNLRRPHLSRRLPPLLRHRQAR